MPTPKQYTFEQERRRLILARALYREFGLKWAELTKLTGMRLDVAVEEGGTIRGRELFEGYRV